MLLAKLCFYRQQKIVFLISHPTFSVYPSKSPNQEISVLQIFRFDEILISFQSQFEMNGIDLCYELLKHRVAKLKLIFFVFDLKFK